MTPVKPDPTGNKHVKSKKRQEQRSRLRAWLSLSLVLSAGLSLLLGRLVGLPFALYFMAGMCFSGAQVLFFRYFSGTAGNLEEGDCRADREGPIAAGALRRTITHEGRTASETRALIAQNSELMSFNFTISHEIKAPVRAIDGYARIFLEDYGQSLDPEARGMVENIRNICKETIALSNKLLEYTRIAQDEPTSEVVDLEGMIREVFDSLGSAGGDHGPVRLAFDSSVPHVIGDPVLLRLAIVNIISNSLKFTRRKEEGVITVGYEKSNGEDVFFIRDNGTGFDMKYSEKLFSMFQRMHTSDEFEGTGIGLAIVKKVVLLHKGRVWITGEVGRGATVYFILPSDKVLR